jgi:ABC-type Fe3+ transport system permease subunit
MVSGAIAQFALGEGIGSTDLATALYAVPGTLAGLGIVYLAGLRTGIEPEEL